MFQLVTTSPNWSTVVQRSKPRGHTAALVTSPLPPSLTAVTPSLGTGELGDAALLRERMLNLIVRDRC